MPVPFETVRQMALSLDKVEEGTSYGTPAFKVGGVLFVRLHQDLDSLVVRTDFEQRAELMAADPETYYITDTTSITRGFWFAWPGFTLMRCGI